MRHEPTSFRSSWRRTRATVLLQRCSPSWTLGWKEHYSVSKETNIENISHLSYTQTYTYTHTESETITFSLLLPVPFSLFPPHVFEPAIRRCWNNENYIWAHFVKWSTSCFFPLLLLLFLLIFSNWQYFFLNSSLCPKHPFVLISCILPINITKFYYELSQNRVTRCGKIFDQCRRAEVFY